MKPTPSEAPIDREFWHRLHPSSIVFSIGGSAIKLLLPGLVVLLLASGSRWEIWLMILFVPTTIYEIIRYLTVRYCFAENEMIVCEGVLYRNERHVPYARIQNIDLVQNLFHRLVGVTEVRLETASGSEPEAEFKVLSMTAVEEMRALVFAGREADATPPQESDAPDASLESADNRHEGGETLLALDTADLIRLGLISNHGFAAVAAALGLAWQFDLEDHLEELDILEPLFERLPGSTLVLLGIALAIFGLILIFALSVAWTNIRFRDFKLMRIGDDLRLSCGLFTRRSATVPRHRVQFVSLHESLFHRMFGCVSIRIETAGGNTDEDEATISRRWFAPLIRREEASRILQAVHPGFLLPERSAWMPMVRPALHRMWKRSCVSSALLTTILMLVIEPWAIAALAFLLPLFLWRAWLNWKHTAYASIPDGIAYRSGAWNRKVSLTLFRSMQTVSFERSPFDYRYRMGTVSVDTPGAGPAGHRIEIPYLPWTDALRLKRRLSRGAESAVFRW